VPTQARAIGESLQELLFDFLCTENFVLFMMIPLVFLLTELLITATNLLLVIFFSFSELS
jgi:hypothetical protein